MNATTRIVSVNLTCGGGASLLVSPAESADGPAVNLLNPDRYCAWKCPNTGSNVTVMFDLGSGSTVVGYVGVLGLRQSVDTQPANTITAYSRTVYPDPAPTNCLMSAGGNPALVGRPSGDFVADGVKVGMSATSAGNIPAGAVVLAVTTASVTLSKNCLNNSGGMTVVFSDRTVRVTLNPDGTKADLVQKITPMLIRYWEFIIPGVTDTFSVSNFMLGLSTGYDDLGFSWSPGTQETVIRSENVLQTAAGNLHVVRYGPDRTKFNVVLNSVPGGVRANFLSYANDLAAGGPQPVLVDGWGRAYQVRLGDLQVTHRWGSPDLYDVAVELEQLP